MIPQSHSTTFNFWIMRIYLIKWQKQGKRRWVILRKTIYSKVQKLYLNNKNITERFEELVLPIFTQIITL
jgi:hypothetical protein